ncbi:MAG: ParA family protein, partial [Deltaproteobacteria bacterium]
MKSNRLYTWTDVQNEIYMELSMGTWPDGLTEVRVFWDGLNILAKSGHEEDVVKWLDKIFGSRFKKYQDNILIILEQHKEKSRHLEVIIETEDEEDMEDDSDESYFRPLIARPIVIRPQYFRNEPPDISDVHPPIFAFHSFKGGVARTVHAMAFALLAAAESEKILLVDADMEAPGITWMLGQRKPKLDISFADMLALIHGEPEDEMDETLELIQYRVRNICLDNMFVMPAFRPSARLVSLEIRPEHLIKYSDNPYIITEMLGELGKKLEVDAVIVDLRAGFSEISAGLLLDPRVHRIFVTTLSDQSLTGTCHEIEYIGKLAGSSKGYMPKPSVILSMIPHLQDRQGWKKVDNIR